VTSIFTLFQNENNLNDHAAGAANDAGCDGTD
jgi:hypothetical protein